MALGAPWSLSSACDVLLIIVFLVATASNSLVLLVFYRKPGLRTLSNRFVINLLVTNLVSCWLLLPLVLTDSLLSPSFPGLCGISQGLSLGVSAASVMSVLLIAVDQYYAVVDPLHYHSHIDTARCGCMISVSWGFSLLWAVAGGLLLNRPHTMWTSCESLPSNSFPFVTDSFISVFSIVFTVLTFVLPFSAICWMYLSIYFAAHENSQRTRRNGSSTGFYTSNTSAAVTATPPVSYAVVPVAPAAGQPDADDPSESPRLSVKSVDGADPAVFVKPSMTRSPTRSSLRSTSSFIMNSLRCRISNASMFKYREETRAARISALVIVMGLVCWCPYSLVVLLSSPLVAVAVPHSAAKLSITLVLVVSVVSPLLFAHRNRRIQRDLRKLFGIARRPAGVTRAPQRRGLPADYSHTALDLLAEGGDEPHGRPEANSGFLSRVWWEGGVRIVTKFDKMSGKSLICVPEVALDVDHSRSSFSSGGSASTQRSTSAASISSYADEC